MIPRLIFFLIIVAYACNQPTTTKSTISLNNSVGIQMVNSKAEAIPETHLKDTMVVSGNFVLFLRPDSIRFEGYANDPESHIYEVDSDFGFAISATMDGLTKHKKYKHIRTDITEKRYILIRECKDSPRIIDRDTIDYGLIMTSKTKAVKSITFLHRGDYLNDVDGYFKLEQKWWTSTNQ